MSDLPELHWSKLRNMARSPAHYFYECSAERTATPAMLLGTAVHTRVLGPGPAHHDDVVIYDGERRGNAWRDFKAAHPGRAIVTAKEFDRDTARSKQMALAVLTDPAAAPYLEGTREQELRWTVAGRQCAGRVDVRGSALVELKTVFDANPVRFYWHALRMGYLGQLGWYADGIVAAGHPAPTHAVIIAVESKPPHPVVVYELTEAALALGRQQWRGLFERLRVCEDSGVWPGYAIGPVALDVPESDDVVLDFGDEADPDSAEAAQ